MKHICNQKVFIYWEHESPKKVKNWKITDNISVRVNLNKIFFLIRRILESARIKIRRYLKFDKNDMQWELRNDNKQTEEKKKSNLNASILFAYQFLSSYMHNYTH